MNKTVVELVLFKLKEGTDLDAFHRAAVQSQRFLSSLSGFMSRELLSSSESGDWVDIVHWRSRDEAMAAMKSFGEAPDAAEFISMLEVSSMKLMHLEPQPLDE